MLRVELLPLKGSEPRQLRQVWGMLSRCLGDLGCDLAQIDLMQSGLEAHAGWLSRVEGWASHLMLGGHGWLPFVTSSIPSCSM